MIILFFFIGYFICPSIGKFIDTLMSQQGKYFECTLLNGCKLMKKFFCIMLSIFFLSIAYQLEQKSCPKGLRFNASRNTCTY